MHARRHIPTLSRCCYYLRHVGRVERVVVGVAVHVPRSHRLGRRGAVVASSWCHRGVIVASSWCHRGGREIVSVRSSRGIGGGGGRVARRRQESDGKPPSERASDDLERASERRSRALQPEAFRTPPPESRELRRGMTWRDSSSLRRQEEDDLGSFLSLPDDGSHSEATVAWTPRRLI
jgi:hypothetical protein